MKLPALILSILLTGLVAPACIADVVWLEREYDFGLMKEAQGPKTGTARFVNCGPEPVVVLEAVPSCGCTGATYPEDPVAPGDTAVITFTYDPTGRPGRFAKTIKVKFDNSRREIIKIRGNVLGTPESLAQFYPVEAGAFRLSEPSASAGNVTMGKTPSRFVNAYNTLNDSVDIRAVSPDPAISIKLSEPKAGPGDIVTVGIYFDTRKWNRPGPVEMPVKIISAPGTEEEFVYELPYRAKVLPVSRPVNAKELAKAPVCMAAPSMIDLGEVRDGTRMSQIALLNEGHAILDVDNVWSDNAAVKIKGFPSKVKKGKTATIEFETAVTELPLGPFRIPVSIATNDPVHPLKVVEVVGNHN